MRLLQPPPAASVEVSPGRHAVRGPIPFPFEENGGQAPADVAFLLRTGSMRAGFRAQGLSYTLIGADPSDAPDARRVANSLRDRYEAAGPAHSYAIEQELVGARLAPPIGSQPAPTRVNYLKGPADQWLTDLPTFYQLERADAWPGIDVLYERLGAGVKSTYVVAPGVDPGQIQLAWHGATAILAEDGALKLETPLGTVQETAPIAWQEQNGQRVPIAVRWAAADAGLDDSVWGFSLGAYDQSLALTIDPTLVYYATYVGGSADDHGAAIAVDSNGAAYLTGSTASTETSFPNGNGFGPGTNQVNVPGFDQSHNLGASNDAFVVKLAPDGTSLVYATFIGGADQDSGSAIAVDSGGNAYVVGDTDSSETTFPNGSVNGLTVLGVPGFDQTYNGNQDAFVVKLAPNGQSLLYATYIGGSALDSGRGIAVDGNANAYVTGQTSSHGGSFPNGGGFGIGVGRVNVPGFDQVYNGGDDAFVVKLAADGQSLVYGTYIGGIGEDNGLAIAIDSTGAAYVTGETGSTESTFPNGAGFAFVALPGFDQFYNGASFDAFVVKIAPDGNTFVYATYIGGNASDGGADIAVDSSGNAYVVGATESTEATFPNGGSLAALNVPGFDQTVNGSSDTFAIKLAPSGQSLAYATFLGGDQIDSGNAIAIDSTGAAYIVGTTGSTETSFPNGSGLAGLSIPGFDQTYNGGFNDGFLVKLAPSGISLVEASYLGGGSNELGLGLALDANGGAYIAGQTTSSDSSFPNGSGMAAVGAPGFDRSVNGGSDGFVVKLGPTVTPTSTVTPTPTATLTLTATPTITVTLTPSPTTTPFACGPRPTVGVNAVAASGGRLQVTVSTSAAPATPGNHLTSLHATPPGNAVVDLLNGPQGLTGDVAIPVGAGTQPVVFFVRRTAPGAIQVPLVATDICGAWPSFVGGGVTAF